MNASMTWADLIRQFEAEWAKQAAVLEQEVKLSGKTLKLVKLMARNHYVAGHLAGAIQMLPRGVEIAPSLKLGGKDK